MFLAVLISLELFFGSFQWSSNLTIALLGNASITCFMIWPIIWCLAKLWQQLLSHYYRCRFYYYRGLQKKMPLHSSKGNGKVNFRPPGNATLLLLWCDSQDWESSHMMVAISKNFMDLVTATKMATMWSLTPRLILQYEDAIHRYLAGIKELYSPAFFAESTSNSTLWLLFVPFWTCAFLVEFSLQALE